MRTRSRQALAAAVAFASTLALAAVPAARSVPGMLPTLYVNYTEGCTFTVTDDGGSPVGSLNPGTYQVAVQTPGDFGGVALSGAPNDMTACRGFVQFQLTGPGVSIQTTLDNGDSDFALATAAFRPNSTYVAVDENQPSVARVVLTTNGSTAGPPPVATGPARPAPTPGAKASTVFRGVLRASVSAAGTLALTTAAGTPVGSLRSGRYTVRVTDGSKTVGFTLVEIGGAARALTSPAFVGTRVVTIELAPGHYFVYPSEFRQRSYFDVLG
jgi:hypothetical protein